MAENASRLFLGPTGFPSSHSSSKKPLAGWKRGGSKPQHTSPEEFLHPKTCSESKKFPKHIDTEQSLHLKPWCWWDRAQPGAVSQFSGQTKTPNAPLHSCFRLPRKIWAREKGREICRQPPKPRGNVLGGRGNVLSRNCSSISWVSFQRCGLHCGLVSLDSGLLTPYPVNIHLFSRNL